MSLTEDLKNKLENLINLKKIVNNLKTNLYELMKIIAMF